jgi:hypothetical protein
MRRYCLGCVIDSFWTLGILGQPSTFFISLFICVCLRVFIAAADKNDLFLEEKASFAFVQMFLSFKQSLCYLFYRGKI